MPQIVPSRWKTKFRHFLLDLDARIDSGLFSSGRGTRELWERFSTFMDRFYVGRWKRWVFIEPLSEMATIGLGGLILMLALAQPAFRETADEDWLKKSDLAVDVPRSLRQSDRQPRHQAQRLSIPLEDFPDNLIKATLATRGPPLLRSLRHRHRRHRARAGHQCAGRRRTPGRLVTDAAAREKSVPVERAHHRAQSQRSVPGHLAGNPPDQE